MKERPSSDGGATPIIKVGGGKDLRRKRGRLHTLCVCTHVRMDGWMCMRVSISHVSFICESNQVIVQTFV